MSTKELRRVAGTGNTCEYLQLAGYAAHRARRDHRHCIYQVLCGNRGFCCSFFSRIVLYRYLLVAKCVGIYING